MIAERFNTQPVELLLAQHLGHQGPYLQEFREMNLLLLPDVFNPALTKVSGFLADNLMIQPNSRVLEMFSGSGALSLIAARTAREVVGIDFSPQAVSCARINAARMKRSDTVDFREADLWAGIASGEQFDLVIANPPLLPAIPETLLEASVADSPDMTTMVRFIKGLSTYLTPNGISLMAFSDACKVYFPDPLGFITNVAMNSGLVATVHAEWDVGYEVYRIIKFKKNHYG